MGLKSINHFNNRMFNILVILFLLSSEPLFSKSRIVPENKFLKDVQLTPSKLKLEGDSIRFTVKGTIPIESVLTPKNPKVSLSYHAEGNELSLGELELKREVASYKYEGRYSLKFEPWMTGATLEVFFYQGRKEDPQPFEKQVLAKGIIAPQLMVKLGEVYPDEPIPVVGLFITSGALDKELVRNEEFSFLFELGSSAYKSSDANSATLKRLDAFLEANPDVQDFKITGLQSPEIGEGRDASLGMNRAESVSKMLGARVSRLSESQFKMDSRRNDWFDLRLLLRDYKGISTNRKDELYAVLMNQESYLEQNERLKKIPGFSQVAQDLYPRLRAARVEITSKPRAGLDMQQSIKLKEALTKNDGTNALSFAEWALAAESTQSIEEKAAIYSKMTEFFRSPLPYNNMAVVRMRQAQRTLDQGSKEILWEEALRLLAQAYRIEPTPHTLHNQGQILALMGDYWEAYKKLSDASTMSLNPNFLQHNEALRGALDILRGDYKLATLRFDYRFTDPKDFFNKGIAYYMLRDFPNANMAFEESVIQGRSFGYGYYGLAMIAAAGGQQEVALIQLKKAIESNRQLASRAYTDPLFYEIRESSEFAAALTEK